MNKPLTITRGDSKTLKMQLAHSTSFGRVAASFSAESIVKCGLKTKTGNQEFTCTIEDATKGEVKCDLSTAQTADLQKGDEQSFYVEVTDGSNRETFIFEKALNIRDQA